MSDERTQLGVEVSAELKRLVDADRRSNREVVEAALWHEYGGIGKSGLEQRIEEVENRISIYESEIAKREQEIEEERRRLSSFREKLHEKRTREERILDDAAEAISPEARETVNPATKNWAAKLGMKPEDFIARLNDHINNEQGDDR